MGNRLDELNENIICDFIEDICEIFSIHGTEPAGRGAGYGIKDAGYEELKELVTRFIEEI